MERFKGLVVYFKVDAVFYFSVIHLLSVVIIIEGRVILDVYHYF